MEELTSRQAEVLQTIQDHIEDTGFPPTRAEIADAFGFRSVNAAEDHLKALERKGVIEILPGTSRGIRLVRNFGLPVIGRVVADKPTLADDNVETHYQLDSRLFKPKAHFLLRMRDASLKDIGIFNGDLLAVHRTRQAKNGQIVVARYNGEITAKRFKRKWKHQIWLMPENADFETTIVDLREEDLTIEGVGVGVIRRGTPL